MALVIKDRVLETSTTTGTGDLTLAGAVTGYQSFAAIGDGNTTPYTIFAVDGSGVPTGDWETGIGTYTASGTTLARTTVVESSNSGSAVSFSSGTKMVACGLTASYLSGLGGGGSAVVSESAGFTLDASVHTDGCKILLDPAAGTGTQIVTLMTLAAQPAAGYQVQILMTGASGGGLSVVANAGTPNINSGSILRAVLTYLDSDNWIVELITNGSTADAAYYTTVLTNADA
jgi:hypothetical protein